jgi:spoIIIJ-associated protein
MDKKSFGKAQELIKNTLKLLGVDSDIVTVGQVEEVIEVQVDLPEEELGVFIGHHGETIASLQLVLALLVNRRLNEWYPVRVNIGDYRERREEVLLKKAEQAAQRAIDSGQEVILPNLNSFERRLVHVHFQENDLVHTESRGEEPFRQLVIVPKTESLV